MTSLPLRLFHIFLIVVGGITLGLSIPHLIHQSSWIFVILGVALVFVEFFVIVLFIRIIFNYAQKKFA